MPALPMEAEARRAEIMRLLRLANAPLTGHELSGRLGVSRQVIVQDIALLRARGAGILATPQGYIIMEEAVRFPRRTFAVQHGMDRLYEELHLMVSLGGRVIDVVVEHPLYGELKGMLMLHNEAEVRRFSDNLVRSGAQPLSALTSGVHLHTVEASDEQVLEAIEKELDRVGLLLKQA